MKVNPQLHTFFMDAIPFVRIREKTDGGFGATPRLPATIEDTYHALHILHHARQYLATNEIGFTPDREEVLRSYLAVRRITLPAGLRTTFQLLWCCRAAGMKIVNETLSASVLAKLQASDLLEDWYYGIRIISELLGKKLLMSTISPDFPSILDKEWRTVNEAWRHIYLFWKLKNILPWAKPELISWFQACQNGDGGFGFFPGTTSFVENCHASLRSLEFLGSKPLEPLRAYRFLASCQTISGGFGRSSRAVPFLDTTWHALASLIIIT